ncbi:MAG: dCMP deaminase [Bacteroidetes bacterium]|nr:dCMP deaminase [Bacteroidota bacterium]MBU1114823.1 dCMP deaminase [Bacteroidota bacterium]MBU1799970.1 dCMP deaminase [Bacteroidota bacterium]
MSEKNKRPSWDEYFLKVAMLVSERATCPRMHVGCVLVKDKQILATGYNGSIPGDAHCEDDGCIIVDNHCVRTNHAEINAITQCANHGVNTSGAKAYVTNMPCTTCSKALIAAGIKEIIVFSDYHNTLATEFFKKADVTIRKLPMPNGEIQYNLDSYSSAKKINFDEENR